MLSSRKLLLGIIFLLSPQAVSANGLTPPVIGGNFAGPVELNSSAVYWNPGTLGQLKGTNIFFDLAPTYFLSSYQASSYPKEVRSSLLSPVFLFGISSDFGLKTVNFALGAYPAFGGSTDWPSNSEYPQRYQATKQAIESINVTPVVSWSILPNLSVGAGGSVVYNTLDASMSQDSYQYVAGTSFTTLTNCTRPEDPGCEVLVHLKKATGLSFGWNAGVFYRPITSLSFGLSYISQVNAAIEGDIDFSSATATNSILKGLLTGAKGKAKVKYFLPQIINFGTRVRINQGWYLDLLARWINWKVHKSIDLDISGVRSPTGSFINGKQVIVRGFEDALSGRLGVIYSGLGWWRIMGAVGYDQSGIPDSTMSASNLEFDKVYVALAFEHFFTRSFKIGAGINHAFLFERKVTNSTLEPPGNANGTYKGNFLEVIDVSAAYHF